MYVHYTITYDTYIYIYIFIIYIYSGNAYVYIYIWYPPKTYQFHKSTGIYSKICYFWYVILDSGIWGMLYSVYIHIYIHRGFKP